MMVALFSIVSPWSGAEIVVEERETEKYWILVDNNENFPIYYNNIIILAQTTEIEQGPGSEPPFFFMLYLFKEF